MIDMVKAKVFLIGEPSTKTCDVVFKRGNKVWRSDCDKLLLFVAEYNCTINVTYLGVLFHETSLPMVRIPMNDPGPRKMLAGDRIEVAGPLKIVVKKGSMDPKNRSKI